MEAQNYFSEVVERHAQERPDDTAFVFKGQETTWKQFNDNINRVANAFLDLGLKPGDKISTILPQSPAFMNVFMAAATMGLVLVPMDPRLKVNELVALCKRTEPKLMVTLAYPESVRNTVESLVKKVSIKHIYSYSGSLEHSGVLPYEKLLESPATPVHSALHPSSEDPLIIIFTSGSTGIPKGAVINHKNTYSMAETTVKSWGLSQQDRVLLNLPTSHVGGTHDLIAVQLYAGATGVLAPSFDPSETLEFISKYRLTFIGGVPTMFRLIFRSCDVGQYDIGSVRLIILGGEPSPPELICKIKENFKNATIAASWGMTETSGFFTFTKLTDSVDVVAQTEGAPGNGYQMKIQNADGTWAETGEIGELLVRGDSVITSYMNEQDNQKTFHHGWLKTGDLGYLDEQNYMHYVGRSKEMYISGGYNVYPLEIESYLNAHPGISSACIIEIPDEIWGQVGYAFVVPKEDVDLKTEDVEAYCREGLADYKRPRRIIIQKELPKTLVGKIAKQEIRNNLGKYLAI